MGYTKYTCHELSKVIHKLQESYSKLKPEDIVEYTNHLIKTLKSRNISPRDIEIIVSASVTKVPKHVEIIEQSDKSFIDIHKYIEKVYNGGIQWIY